MARRPEKLPSWLAMSAPLLMPGIAVGLSFGVLAGQAGLGAAGGAVMSATTFAASAQFAAVSLLAADAGVAVAVLAAVSLNIRYLPMGIAVAPWFTGPIWRRVLKAHVTTDESWAMAQRPDGSFDTVLMTRIGLVFLIRWVASTALGAHFGSRVDNVEQFGLDAVVPTVFLALLILRLRKLEGLRIASVATLLALVTTPLTPEGVPILLSMMAVLAGGRR